MEVLFSWTPPTAVAQLVLSKNWGSRHLLYQQVNPTAHSLELAQPSLQLLFAATVLVRVVLLEHEVLLVFCGLRQRFSLPTVTQLKPASH